MFRDKTPVKPVSSELPRPVMQLGGYRLEMDESGNWVTSYDEAKALQSAAVSAAAKAAALAGGNAAAQSAANTAALMAEVARLQQVVQQLSTENKALTSEMATLKSEAQSLKGENNGLKRQASMDRARAVAAISTAPAAADQHPLERAVEVAQVRKQLVEEEARHAELKKYVQELEFRNRVLLAMCTISEGDYLELCKEADVDPRACNAGFGSRFSPNTSPTLTSPASRMMR